MDRRIKTLKLSVSILKEGKRFVAYSPALDLSTSGKSAKEVQKRFEQSVKLFFSELLDSGNTEKVLRSLGWQKEHKKWSPPKVVKNTSETIRIPVAA